MINGMKPDEIERAMMVKMEKQQKISAELMEKNPTLPIITAMIMAGDILSRETADHFVATNQMDAEAAALWVGSYARLDWLVDQYEAGRLSDEWLLRCFHKEWRDADPDDSNPKFLALWKKVHELNGKKPRVDEDEFPYQPNQIIEVYRGNSSKDDPLGFAWTIDEEIATAFAKGRGLRTGKMNGVVLVRYIQACDVLGYITGRGESEIVCDPNNLRKVKRWKTKV